MNASFAATPARGAKIVVMGDDGTLLAEQPGPDPADDGIVVGSRSGAPLAPLRRRPLRASYAIPATPAWRRFACWCVNSVEGSNERLAVAELRRRLALPAGPGRGESVVRDGPNDRPALIHAAIPSSSPMTRLAWPELPYDAWKDTYATLHMWLQIVGKIRLAQMPWQNHTWQVTLYPTATGLTTGRMPHGHESFEMEFDFVAHELVIRTNRGDRHAIALAPMSVAQFYASVMAALATLRMPVSIYRRPCEVENPVSFDEDAAHCSYDPEYAGRCSRVLISAAEVLGRFRSHFYGKASPVHFFWGSFDLAVTRFSGAPRRRIRAGCRAFPIGSRATRIRTR